MRTQFIWRVRTILLGFLLTLGSLLPAALPAHSGTGDNYPEPWRSAPSLRGQLGLLQPLLYLVGSLGAS